MSAIYDALIGLNNSLVDLEGKVDAPLKKIHVLSEKLTEKKRVDKTGQPDLFSMGGTPANKNINFDTSMFVRKLDMAIDKVEQVLREG